MKPYENLIVLLLLTPYFIHGDKAEDPVSTTKESPIDKPAEPNIESLWKKTEETSDKAKETSKDTAEETTKKESEEKNNEENVQENPEEALRNTTAKTSIENVEEISKEKFEETTKTETEEKDNEIHDEQANKQEESGATGTYGNQNLHHEKKPFQKHDFSSDPEYVLIKAINFIKEEIATHLMTDRELNEAIRAIHGKEMKDMVATLKEHPKYQTLDTLLNENNLGTLEYFDIMKFRENLPKRSRIKPSFERLMKHIFAYLRRDGVLPGMRNVFEKTEFYRILHKAIIKQKVQMLVNDLVNLRITQKIITRLNTYKMHVNNIINSILYIAGYLDSYTLPPD